MARCWHLAALAQYSLLLALAACTIWRARHRRSRATSIAWIGTAPERQEQTSLACRDRSIEHLIYDAMLCCLTRHGRGRQGDLQAFLESTPYDTRSWLADYSIDDARLPTCSLGSTATASTRRARSRGMQVESSLVSATVKPSTAKINHALGCGCLDAPCVLVAICGPRESARCAVDVLSEHIAGSVEP